MSANSLCKGPDNKYFRLYSHKSLLQLLNSAVVAGKRPQTITIPRHGCVPIKLYLQNQVAVGFGPTLSLSINGPSGLSGSSDVSSAPSSTSAFRSGEVPQGWECFDSYKLRSWALNLKACLLSGRLYHSVELDRFHP